MWFIDESDGPFLQENIVDPKPIPRKRISKSLTNQIVIKDLPDKASEWPVRMYFKRLCGAECKSIKLGKRMAIMEMPCSIGRYIEDMSLVYVVL